MPEKVGRNLTQVQPIWLVWKTRQAARKEALLPNRENVERTMLKRTLREETEGGLGECPDSCGWSPDQTSS